MLKYFENLTSKETVILTSLVSIFVGLGTDQEVLKLLPPVAAMLIQKSIIYGGGGTILYKMMPKSGEPK